MNFKFNRIWLFQTDKIDVVIENSLYLGSVLLGLAIYCTVGSRISSEVRFSDLGAQKFTLNSFFQYFSRVSMSQKQFTPATGWI